MFLFLPLLLAAAPVAALSTFNKEIAEADRRDYGPQAHEIGSWNYTLGDTFGNHSPPPTRSASRGRGR